MTQPTRRIKDAFLELVAEVERTTLNSTNDSLPAATPPEEFRSNPPLTAQLSSGVLRQHLTEDEQQAKDDTHQQEMVDVYRQANHEAARRRVHQQQQLATDRQKDLSREEKEAWARKEQQAKEAELKMQARILEEAKAAEIARQAERAAQEAQAEAERQARQKEAEREAKMEADRLEKAEAEQRARQAKATTLPTTSKDGAPLTEMDMSSVDVASFGISRKQFIAMGERKGLSRIANDFYFQGVYRSPILEPLFAIKDDVHPKHLMLFLMHLMQVDDSYMLHRNNSYHSLKILHENARHNSYRDKCPVGTGTCGGGWTCSQRDEWKGLFLRACRNNSVPAETVEELSAFVDRVMVFYGPFVEDRRV